MGGKGDGAATNTGMEGDGAGWGDGNDGGVTDRCKCEAEMKDGVT